MLVFTLLYLLAAVLYTIRENNKNNFLLNFYTYILFTLCKVSSLYDVNIKIKPNKTKK